MERRGRGLSGPVAGIAELRAELAREGERGLRWGRLGSGAARDRGAELRGGAGGGGRRLGVAP